MRLPVIGAIAEFSQFLLITVMIFYLTGTLYFAHLTKDDHRKGKVYKCVVRNAVLDSSRGGSYTTVEVSGQHFCQTWFPGMLIL